MGPAGTSRCPTGRITAYGSPQGQPDDLRWPPGHRSRWRRDGAGRKPGKRRRRGWKRFGDRNFVASMPLPPSRGCADLPAITNLFTFPPDLPLRTCSAEDLVVLKTFASRPQDWLDIDGIIIRQSERLDWPYIRAQLAPLAELKDAPELVDALERRRVATNCVVLDGQGVAGPAVICLVATARRV